MDRALFLKRLITATVCAAVPPDVLRLLDRPEPYYTLDSVVQKPVGVARGWWVENGSGDLLLAQLNVAAMERRWNLETHFVPPDGGVNVMFTSTAIPVGGELTIEIAGRGVVVEGGTERREDAAAEPVPLVPLAPGYFVGSNADLSVFAGVYVA